MNKILYWASCLAVCTACNDFLDEMPDNRTSLDSEKNIASLLVTSYPDQTSCLIGEFLSDNIDENRHSFTYWHRLDQELYLLQDPTEERQDSPHGLWQSCYQAIAQANYALKAIEEKGNPASLDASRGEALLCRAYSAFTLATIFCEVYNHETAEKQLGIPYPTEPETTVNPKYERGTLAEVYRRIEADLETGLPLISDDAYKVPKYHFNRRAAYAFAARFYLYYMQPDLSNLKKTIEYATRVLGPEPSALLRNWQALGTLSPNGDVQPNAYVDANEPANLLLVSSSSRLGGTVDAGWQMGTRYAHNALAAKEVCESSGPWGAYTTFYQQPFTPGSNPKKSFRRVTLYQKMSIDGNSYWPYTIVPLFTTDETLITRAEAYALLGQYEEAAADITTWQKNYTSNKRNVTPDDIVSFYSKTPYYEPSKPTVKKHLSPDFIQLDATKEAFIDCVLHIRRILTLGEGVRWQDIRRYGITVHRRYVESGAFVEVTDTAEKGDPRMVMQIPRSVISAGMTPNPRAK